MPNKNKAFMIMVPLVSAVLCHAEILVGWNYFDPNDNSSVVNDTSPDVVASGFAGTMGGNVNPLFATVGGGERADGTFQGANNTFGSLAGTGVSTNNSGVRFAFTGNKERLDFEVTNLSGSDVSIDSIHFDIKCQFKGGAAETDYGTVKLIHFSPASDLEDGVSSRNLLLGDGVLSDFSWREFDVSTTGSNPMTDVILANNESAVFRIDVDWTAVAGGTSPTWNVDNVAIAGTVIPEPATLGLIIGAGGSLVLMRRRFLI